MDVILDGKPISIPAECRSLSTIRTYLERLALAQQRVLVECVVDGLPANFSGFGWANNSFRCLEAKTSQLTDLSSEVLSAALKQTTEARALVETAVTLVLINDAPLAREIWCELVGKLKAPLLTLGLLPDSNYRQPEGCVSFRQMREWQIEQYGCIIEQVNEASSLAGSYALSNALEHRALPWLQKLQDLIELWLETALAGARILDRVTPLPVADRVVTLQA